MRAALRAAVGLLVLRAGAAALACGATTVASASLAAETVVPEPPRPTGEEPAEVIADRIEFDRARDLYTAEGNVRLSQGRRTLTADWVTFSNATRQGVASGSVVVVDGPDTMRAKFMEFNIDTLEGVVFDGYIDGRTSPFKMSGKEIQRSGRETYTFQEAVFSPCRCPDPEDRDPWQIRSDTVELDDEGYGKARNTTFDVLGVPVLYFPYLIYPVKRERESGFLFPTFSRTSRSGLEIGTPFFWAAREDLNVFLTPQWLQYRGFKPSVDAEYVFGREDVSRLHASYIYDNEIEEDNPSTPYDANRWAVRYFHDQWLPGKTRLQADVNLVSDNSYAFDFDDMRQFRSDRFMISQGIVTKAFGATGRYYVVGTTILRDDLQSPDDVDRDELALQRLPDLSLSVLPGPMVDELPFSPSLDAQYTYFYAINSANGVLGDARNVNDVFYDTGIDGITDPFERDASGQFGSVDGSQDNFPPGPEGDFQFADGEILAGSGHRLLMTPRLGAPLRLFDFLEVLPEAGYRTAIYQTTRLGGTNRGYATGRVDLRTRFRRTLDLPLGLGETTHLLEPRVGWAMVAKTVVADTPVFVPESTYDQERVRMLDLNNVTRDPADDLPTRNVLAAGFGNRFYGRGIDGSTPRLLADFTMLGQYDFAQDRAGELVLDGTAYPGGNIYTRLILGYQMDDQRFEEALLQASWSSPEGNDLSFSYRFLDSIPVFFEAYRFDDDRFDSFTGTFSQVNQFGVYARWALTRNWALTYSGSYSAEQSVFLGNQGGIEYLSECRCWAVRLEADEDPVSGARFNVKYRLLGLGDDTVRPFAGYRGGGILPSGGSQGSVF